MIIFPPEFRRTQYPGYVFNTATKELFTFKGGTLKKLVPSFVNQVRHFYHKMTLDTQHQKCYRISVEGRRRIILMEELLAIPPIAYDMINITQKEKRWSTFRGGNKTLSKLYGYGREVQWYNERIDVWESLPPADQKEFDDVTETFWRVSNKKYTFRASN